MEYTPENISGLLIRSKLLSPEQVRTIYDRWKSEDKEHGKSAPHYLKWIVARNYLTEYQAALIAHGHADNFFLGQYKILDRLGKGRMAGVYKAVHNLGQTVAIKVLPPSKVKDQEMLGRFKREAHLAMKLKHPNVVRSFQLGESNGLHYLVMEYLDGETLEEVLQRRKKLPYQEAVRLIHQALEGLQHIHEKGMVHRDIKPANLMLVPARAAGEPDTTLNATLKILDIGLGREMFDESAQAAMARLELTGEGALLGTPDYMAPEQARDPRAIDIRADIYSMGCTLYHCLTGRPPFPDKNILNQMVRHATEAPRPVRELVPDVPDGLQQVINWMLAKKPEERYPTPGRAAKAMQVFLAKGAEVHAIDEAPQMRRYLTWLETSDQDIGKEQPAPDRNDRPKPKSDKKLKKEKRPKRSPEPPVAVAESKAPIRPDEFDVELVAMPAPAAVPTAALPAKRSLLALSRRDWIFMGMGAGAVIFAMLVGVFLSWLASFFG